MSIDSARPSQAFTVRAVLDNPSLFPKPSLPPSRNDLEPSFGIVSPSFPRELQTLLEILPPRVRHSLEQHEQLLSLVEVVLDLGRPPVARFPQGDWCICNDVVAAEDIEECVAQVGWMDHGWLGECSLTRNSAAAWTFRCRPLFIEDVVSVHHRYKNHQFGWPGTNPLPLPCPSSPAGGWLRCRQPCGHRPLAALPSLLDNDSTSSYCHDA